MSEQADKQHAYVKAWLGAYYDGELGRLDGLHGRRLRQVEAHLAQCEACRAELETLAMLSAVLRESPEAKGLKSPERFVAEVGLKLPRRPEKTAWQRTLEVGWRFIPVGLLGVWIFMQAVSILVIGMLAFQSAGLPLNGFVWDGAASGIVSVLNVLSGFSGGLRDLPQVVLRMVRAGGPLGWQATLNFAIVVGLGLLYWSWLASWWIQHKDYQAK